MSRTTESRTVTQEITTGVRCDACGKTAQMDKFGNPPAIWHHFMSGHSDWGNDSVESVEWWDVCSFACYLTIARKVFDDYGNTDGGSLDFDDKSGAFVRDMLAHSPVVA